VSPFLFGVYIDELSLCLQTVNIGCRLSYKLINHLLFADDAVVFAPLPRISNSYEMSALNLLPHTTLFLMSPNLSASSSSLAMTSLVVLHFESVGRPYPILTAWPYY